MHTQKHTHTRSLTRTPRPPLSLTLNLQKKYRKSYLESLVDVVHQGEQLDEVIHGDGDDGRAEGGGGQGDEATLPLQGEDGEQRARAQEDTQRYPHCPGVVELLHDLKRHFTFISLSIMWLKIGAP